MKIALAQTRPVKGDIPANIAQHKQLIDLAIAQQANAVIFPELSITGYEPELGAELATTQDDARLNDFQPLSDAYQLLIGVGSPIQTAAGVCIGMVIFQPQQPRQTYLKKYLYVDEVPFFTCGQESVNIIDRDARLALAICYELSVPEHAAKAAENGAAIYIASAVESFSGIEKAHTRLAKIARDYGMTVLLSNCIGLSGGYDCAGRSAAWNSEGELLGEIESGLEGLLVVNTVTGAVAKVALREPVLSKDLS